MRDRIVLPVVRRNQLLQLAHSNRLGGYFSVRKTKAAIQKLFTWPGNTKNVH